MSDGSIQQWYLGAVVFAAHYHVAVRPSSCRVSLMPVLLTPLDPQSVNDTFLTTMITGPRDYGYFSKHCNVVLVLDEVDHLVLTVTQGTRHS